MAQFKAANVDKAAAVDGWRIAELKELPENISGMAAQMIEAVEHANMGWPTVMPEGVMLAIPKGDAHDQGDKVAPEDFGVGTGLDTRRITVLSPLWTAYGSQRYADMAEWREKWQDKSMHGAKKSHEVFNVSWELGLEVEEAHLRGVPLSGSRIDRRKFFDLLEFEIGDKLLEALGADAKVLRAEWRFYEQLRCRWKVHQAVGESWQRKNGCIQGCSWSLTHALAIMTVETRAVQREARVRLSSFYRATGEDHAQQVAKACKASKDFDDAAGTQTNDKNTKFDATTTEAERELEAALESEMPGMTR